MLRFGYSSDSLILGGYNLSMYAWNQGCWVHACKQVINIDISKPSCYRKIGADRFPKPNFTRINPQHNINGNCSLVDSWLYVNCFIVKLWVLATARPRGPVGIFFPKVVLWYGYHTHYVYEDYMVLFMSSISIPDLDSNTCIANVLIDQCVITSTSNCIPEHNL